VDINLLKEKVTLLLKGLDLDDAKSFEDVVYRITEEVSVYHQELWYQKEELLRVQQELEKSQQYFYSIFEDAPVGYIICNAHMDILRVNNTLLRQLELDATDLLRHSLKEIIQDEFQDAFYFFERELDKLNRPASLEIELRGLRKTMPVTLQGSLYREEDVAFYRFAIMENHQMK
jgi:PAS domain S-box-containing protein